MKESEKKKVILDSTGKAFEKNVEDFKGNIEKDLSKTQYDFSDTEVWEFPMPINGQVYVEPINNDVIRMRNSGLITIKKRDENKKEAWDGLAFGILRGFAGDSRLANPNVNAKIGDVVIHNKWADTTFQYGEETFIKMHETDVFGIIKPKKKIEGETKVA